LRRACKQVAEGGSKCLARLRPCWGPSTLSGRICRFVWFRGVSAGLRRFRLALVAFGFFRPMLMPRSPTKRVLGPKGTWPFSRLQFWDPAPISGSVGAEATHSQKWHIWWCPGGALQARWITGRGRVEAGGERLTTANAAVGTDVIKMTTGGIRIAPISIARSYLCLACQSETFDKYGASAFDCRAWHDPRRSRSAGPPRAIVVSGTVRVAEMRGSGAGHLFAGRHAEPVGKREKGDGKRGTAQSE